MALEYNKHSYYNRAMQDNVAFLAGDIGRLFRKRFEASASDRIAEGLLTGPQMRLLATISRGISA